MPIENRASEDKPFIKLGRSEQAIVQSAATIYAAYVRSGSVSNDNTSEWLERSANEAILLAKAIDRGVIADGEMG